jgi:hypothetical protein
MLRKVNSALFEGPPGVQIQVVVESRGNNDVHDARFEYAFSQLPTETILGLPGCSFMIDGTPQILQAEVVFDSGTPGSARYDMFEVENGVKNNLEVPVKHSQAEPKIAFTIDPVLVEVAVTAKTGSKTAAKKKSTKKKKPPKKPGKGRTPGKKRTSAKKANKAKKRPR